MPDRAPPGERIAAVMAPGSASSGGHSLLSGNVGWCETVWCAETSV